MSDEQDTSLPIDVRITAAIPSQDAIERLRATLEGRPTIEGRRHWLTERCVTGGVDDEGVWLDLRRRYFGRLYARNPWAVRFTGAVNRDQGRMVLFGEIDYRFPSGARAIWTWVRAFAVVVAVVAVVIGIEGVATGRVDEMVAALLVVPAVVVFVGLPHLAVPYERAARRAAMDDAAFLNHFLETTLSAAGTATKIE